MPEFHAITTVADHRLLDDSEVLIGYMDGFEGRPLSGNAYTRSYFHGWRNGMVDAGTVEPDWFQLQLAAAFQELAPPNTLH